MGLSRNVFGVLERTALSHARDEIAFVYDGDARTFATVRERSLRVATGLQRAGIAPGDRVAVLLANGHEWTEVFFGLAALGAVCVPVNVLLQPAEIEHVCRDSGARCLVVDERSRDAVQALPSLPEIVVGVGDVRVDHDGTSIAYADLVAGPAPAVWPGGPELDDLASLYYSSGTTGLPKAAAHTHGGIIWNSYHQLHDLGLDRDVRYLVVPSLSWAAGFNNLTLALVMLGGRSVIMPTGGASPDKLTEAIEREGITHTFFVPTLLRRFLEEPALLERLRASSLRWLVSGSEPVPRAVIERLAAALPDCRIVQGYGLSEFPTIATLLRPEEAISHSGSAGRPLSITDLAIQQADGEIVRAGEGEILLRSLATMREYFDRPEETAAAFADGWLHTGDLGTVDADGFLTITGRKKDMIISGGLNIYPKEIEEVIYRLPGVLEAAVVGVPDDRWGETAVAVVVGTDLDTAAIADACKEQLASYKRPRAVLVRDEPLPRNPTGKVLKRELRPWAADRMASNSKTGEKIA
ncbi:MAG: Long-chain-fatty-acid--CoA ligase FadD13 [Frankiales bacterium]|nr:Long-chain-fatty-acid--CoA ligase FadD13 [Frankiales bacterium]